MDDLRAVIGQLESYTRRAKALAGKDGKTTISAANFGRLCKWSKTEPAGTEAPGAVHMTCSAAAELFAAAASMKAAAMLAAA
jgi:hypothetical protein